MSTPTSKTMEASSSTTASHSTSVPISTLPHVQAFWDRMKPNSPIYDIFFSNITLISATPDGRALARLPLIAVHLNSRGILHGAVSAALVDWAGGIALAATGTDKTGVSVDIHVTYAGPARVGDTLEIESWVVRKGGTLGFTQVEIRKAADDGNEGKKGAIVATGSHTKYLNIGRA